MEKIKNTRKILTDYQMKEPALWENLNSSLIKPSDCKHMYFDKNLPNYWESPNKTQM